MTNRILLCEKCSGNTDRVIEIAGFGMFCSECGLNAKSWYVQTPNGYQPRAEIIY